MVELARAEDESMTSLVSIFADHEARAPSAHLPVSAILAAIKSPRPRVVELCAAIRLEGDKEKRRALKSKLPAVCFGAQLSTRKAGAQDKILAESGVICLDFDSVADLAAAKAKLAGAKHVLAVFVSPSGSGLKVLVPILGPWAAHWRALAHHMMVCYGLAADEARKDVCGLCYASHDPEIWTAQGEVEPFAGVMEDPGPARGPAPEMDGHLPHDGEVLADFLDVREAELAVSRLAPDMDYPDWLAVGQAIHCQFGGSGQGFAIWDAWSARGSKYPGTEDLAKKYQSFRSSGVTFRTVLKQALDAGYQMPKRTSSTARKEVPAAPAVADAPDLLGSFIASEMSGEYHLTAWPWPRLTELSRSLLPGAVTILCGAPGASKSWFGLSCLNFWTSNGISAQVLMLEETKQWHLNRLLTMLEGDKAFLDPAKTKANAQPKMRAYAKHMAAIKAVESRLWCTPNLTMAACADWVEKRCAEGARVLVVDPITLADNGSEKPWEADRRFIARCGDAISKSGTSLVLVTHPRKATGPTKGPPQMDDMAGGAAYSRAASSIIWLGPSRPWEDIDQPTGTTPMRADRQIKILKSRNGVGTGKNIIYQFNDFTFEEIGLSDAEKPKAKANTYEGEMEAMEKTRRAEAGKKLAMKPQDNEDLFT